MDRGQPCSHIGTFGGRRLCRLANKHISYLVERSEAISNYLQFYCVYGFIQL